MGGEGEGCRCSCGSDDHSNCITAWDKSVTIEGIVKKGCVGV